MGSSATASTRLGSWPSATRPSMTMLVPMASADDVAWPWSVRISAGVRGQMNWYMAGTSTK